MLEDETDFPIPHVYMRGVFSMKFDGSAIWLF